MRACSACARNRESRVCSLGSGVLGFSGAFGIVAADPQNERCQASWGSRGSRGSRGSPSHAAPAYPQTGTPSGVTGLSGDRPATGRPHGPGLVAGRSCMTGRPRPRLPLCDAAALIEPAAGSAGHPSFWVALVRPIPDQPPAFYKAHAGIQGGGAGSEAMWQNWCPGFRRLLPCVIIFLCSGAFCLSWRCGALRLACFGSFGTFIQLRVQGCLFIGSSTALFRKPRAQRGSAGQAREPIMPTMDICQQRS